MQENTLAEEEAVVEANEEEEEESVEKQIRAGQCSRD